MNIPEVDLNLPSASVVEDYKAAVFDQPITSKLLSHMTGGEDCIEAYNNMFKDNPDQVDFGPIYEKCTDGKDFYLSDRTS